MKRSLLPITVVVLLSVLIYSCSSDDDNSAESSVIQTPTPEPEQTTTQYTLTVSAGDGGSVSSEGGTYDSGTQITINTNPDNKYQFVSWSNGSTNPSLSITITENISITANFRLNGMIFTRNSFNIINPNQRKIDLLMTLNSNPGIFVYQKNNFKYLIVPGVSDGEQTCM